MLQCYLTILKLLGEFVSQDIVMNIYFDCLFISYNCKGRAMTVRGKHYITPEYYMSFQNITTSTERAFKNFEKSTTRVHYVLFSYNTG